MNNFYRQKVVGTRKLTRQNEKWVDYFPLGDGKSLSGRLPN